MKLELKTLFKFRFKYICMKLHSRHFYINRLMNKISTNIFIWSIFDANKLTGPNFLDWYQNLRILLKQEKILYVLESLISHVPNVDALIEVRTKYYHYIGDNEQVMILAGMSLEL